MIGVPMSNEEKQSTPFPQAVARRPDGRLDLWVCTRCGYTYDGSVGEPISRILPNTPFEALPDAWRCPHCTAEKSYFFH